MNFYQGNLSNSSLSVDIDFNWFSIFDKKLRRLSIDEFGSFGFLIFEVRFLGLFIKHIKFHGLSFNETSFLAMHLFDDGPPGLPVCEVVLVLVSPLTKAVSMDPNSMVHNFTNFPSIEFNSVEFKSIQLVSMDFFQSKRYPRNFNQCNRFPRKSYPQSFNFSHDFPINRFCSQGLPTSGKSFFGSHRL